MPTTSELHSPRKLRRAEVSHHEGTKATKGGTIETLSFAVAFVNFVLFGAPG
jgi:hypothetical protein